MIQHTANESESILFATKKHFIIFFYPVLMTLVSPFLYSWMQQQFLLRAFAPVPLLIAFILLAFTLLLYLTSSYSVQGKLLVMREGFFFRRICELKLTSIVQIEIEQSLLGRILDYGMVRVVSMGANDYFGFVARPLLLQRTINAQQKL